MTSKGKGFVWTANRTDVELIGDGVKMVPVLKRVFRHFAHPAVR
jgi:hypothetical protein